MTHASVFSGIGGSEVAASMLGWENLFHCEINPFGRAVLEYWFPNAKSYEDITTTDFSEWSGRVNVLTGGFPCQPFSYAGQRRGAQDDRYLWPYMHRCINQVRPDWVVCENVAGITTMVEQGDITEVATEKSLFDEGDTLYRYRLEETFTLERICDDLEGDGYAVQAVIIPACAVNAPHRRDRVFIIGCRNDIADTDCDGLCARRSSGRIWAQMDGRRIDEPLNGFKRFSAPRSSADPVGGGSDRIATGESGQAARQDSQLDAEPAINGGVLPESSPHTESEQGGRLRPEQPECGEPQQGELGGRNQQVGCGGDATDTNHAGLEEERPQEPAAMFRGGGLRDGERDEINERSASIAGCGRWANFPTVSPVHRGNDGLPFSLDDLTIPASKWRTESLKAYGNAIVPQVMYEIFRAIEQVYHNLN